MHRWLLLLSMAAFGCESPAPSSGSATTTTAAAAAATSATSGAASAAAATSASLKPAQPKAYKDTAETELGTLPEGVGVPVGSKAPDFRLPTVEGGQLSLGELLKKSAVLLVFYRGGW